MPEGDTVLFMERVHPFARVRELDDRRIESLVGAARLVLRANVSEDPAAARAGRRTTGRDNPAERLWVYGRARKPCRRCGTPISAVKQGPDARLSYWCETCQSRGS